MAARKCNRGLQIWPIREVARSLVTRVSDYDPLHLIQ